MPVLTWIIAAPVTRTIRQIPTEVRLGMSHGLPDDCVASFDNLQPIRRSFLTQRAGDDPATRAITRATTGLCEELGIDVIMEGIEAGEQAAAAEQVGRGQIGQRVGKGFRGPLVANSPPFPHR